MFALRGAQLQFGDVQCPRTPMKTVFIFLPAVIRKRSSTNSDVENDKVELTVDGSATTYRFLFRAIVSPESPRTTGCGPEPALTQPIAVSLLGIAFALHDRKANPDRLRSEQA